ncbi:flagellin N-terminal helical domain-containing protein [Halomonas qaidamensis]|nr:flagellin [Halomonas qaidamensis]
MPVINTNLSALNTQQGLGKSKAALTTSMERLASGLRVNSAKDDAAGQAIANRMDANLRANTTVTRGINDGVSLMQTAEGGLDGINDILQRSRELAVQAANGTLSDGDRASINAEYKELRAEIDRIAKGTEAFGKYPLAPTESRLGETQSMGELFQISGTNLTAQSSGVEPVTYIPVGAKNITITVDGLPGAEDDIQIFTRSGKHLVGTPLNDYTWVTNGVSSAEEIKNKIFQNPDKNLGFLADAEYDASELFNVEPAEDAVFSDQLEHAETRAYKDMLFTYTGDGDRFNSDSNNADGATDSSHSIERLNIDKTTEPLILVVTGQGIFNVQAEWDAMPASNITPPISSATEIVVDAHFGEEIETITIEPTPADHLSLGLEDVELDPLEKAREAMAKLQEALNQVDGYRSQYGALANRFESAIENLATQSLNTAAAQSRIMDADYAKESSSMIKMQILQQAGSSMLAQANQIPQNVLSLLG